MMSGETQKACFVIAPIDKEGSEIRLRSDNVLKYIIKPVALACGYEAIRADEISEPGIIPNQIFQNIEKADLVIADLTGGNPNVFYELAIQHCLRKSCVLIAQSSNPLPFDLAPARTIYFHENDMGSVENCKQEMIKQIKAAELAESFDSPISIGIDILQLRRSDNLAEKRIAEILSMLQDLRGEFVKNLREQSERILELQSLLTINAQNDLKDQSSSTGMAQYTGNPVSKEMEWDKFIARTDLFDRTNLVGLLDSTLSQNTNHYMTLNHHTYMPGSYASSYYYAGPHFGFEISIEQNGDYKISFLTCSINVNKEDLKTFRDYVAKQGIYSAFADASISGIRGYTDLG